MILCLLLNWSQSRKRTKFNSLSSKKYQSQSILKLSWRVLILFLSFRQVFHPFFFRKIKYLLKLAHYFANVHGIKLILSLPFFQLKNEFFLDNVLTKSRRDVFQDGVMKAVMKTKMQIYCTAVYFIALG